MKLEFLKLSPDERRLYIEQAAIQRNIFPIIMEKDFFVCWLLRILFESEFAESLVFKGGTSLSKIFGAINRFSEDIDLSLSPTFLGLPETAANRSQAAIIYTRVSTDEQAEAENIPTITVKDPVRCASMLMLLMNVFYNF